jgi:hypothetical protein
MFLNAFSNMLCSLVQTHWNRSVAQIRAIIAAATLCGSPGFG